MQLEAIASPVTGDVGEETNPHLTTPSCQGAAESEKVSPQPPLLQTEQPQLPQPLPVRLVCSLGGGGGEKNGQEYFLFGKFWEVRILTGRDAIEMVKKDLRGRNQAVVLHARYREHEAGTART